MYRFQFKNGEIKAGRITKIEGDKYWIQFVGNAVSNWIHLAELATFSHSGYVKHILADIMSIGTFRIFHNGNMEFFFEGVPNVEQMTAINTELALFNWQVEFDIGQNHTYVKISS